MDAPRGGGQRPSEPPVVRGARRRLSLSLSLSGASPAEVDPDTS